MPYQKSCEWEDKGDVNSSEGDAGNSTPFPRSSIEKGGLTDCRSSGILEM